MGGERSSERCEELAGGKEEEEELTRYEKNFFWGIQDKINLKEWGDKVLFKTKK